MGAQGDADAVAELGWSGAAARVALLGRSYVCGFVLNAPVHAARLAAGQRPCPDPGQLFCAQGDANWITTPPVELRGLLVQGRSWRRAAADAAAVSAFAPVAVALPEKSCSREIALDADLAGLGLLAACADGSARLVVPPTRFVSPPPTPMQALVAEIVYTSVWDRLLSDAAA